MLQSTALRLQGRNPSVSHYPSQARSQGHSQWIFVHDRIGPNLAQNRDNQDNRDNRDNQDNRDNRVNWGAQGGRDGDTRDRPPVHPAPHNPPWQNDRDEGGAESEYREVRVPNKFPCFARRLLSVQLPYKFKPSNQFKYNGKIEPNQWLRIYS
jgi:hypothetical protein